MNRKETGMIRHILLIKFKEEAEASEIEKLKGLFEAMPSKVEGVTSVEWGLNDSPENKNQGYTHSVLMTFADEAGRQNYLPHPEHDALKDVFRPLLDDIIVFDYSL
ncbi:Dabb family protein [Vibrio lentus]|nr:MULTISPECIES: Dabb family protein [Vibrio]MCC4785284.1 Dabb family protein [Vibrio lentus]MCZ8500781.1 Dabb family protein [Vibrio lentus]MDN2668347.1 Dabb family protein [Vibrio sp. 14N.309.X.WAT.E.F5]PHX04663.1 Stress responsive A/B Barrel Domain protein [Vibrio splendidus]|tara:strand:+ start:209 stop:526 length:318 start_codon:yes stop_codon:yes gene_type:complete